MADVRYSVEVEFLTKGNIGKSLGLGGAMSSLGSVAGASGAAAATKWENSFNKAFGSMSGSVQKLTSLLSFERLFDGAASAAQGALGLIKYGLIEMNAEIEGMTIGLGTIFTANGVTDNLSSGMGKASEMLKQMRKDAAVLPGEFKDLASIFQTMLAPALNSGMDSDKIQEMATHAMAYGTAIGLRSPVIGREMAALLSGQARSQNILAQRLPGLSLHGDAAKKFNALSQGDRVGVLSKSLGMLGGQEGKAYEQALIAYSKSWQGILTSLKDNFKLFAMGATEPLFERLKGAFGWLNNWFSTHGEKVKSWADDVGRMLGSGFDAAAAAAEKMMPRIEKLIDFIQASRDHGKLQGGASRLAGGLAGAATMAAVAPTVLSGMGGVASGLLKLTAANPEAGIAAFVAMAASMVPLTAIALGVGGAMDALGDNLSIYHGVALGLLNTIKEELKSTQAYTSAIWDQIEEPLRNLAQLMGVGMLTGIDLAIMGLNAFLAVIQSVAHFLKPYLYIMGLTGRINPNDAMDDRTVVPEKLFGTIADTTDKKRAPKGENHTTNIGHIEIKVISNTDPNRIAKKVMTAFQESSRNPTTVPTPNGQLYR